MNPIPRIAINTAVGIGTLFGVHEALYEASTTEIATTPMQQVNACAEALGSTSLAAADLEPCRPYLNELTITRVTPLEGNSQVVLDLPNKADFLQTHLLPAQQEDDERIQSLQTLHAEGYFLGAIAAALVVAGSNAGLKRLERKADEVLEHRRAVGSTSSEEQLPSETHASV